MRFSILSMATSIYRRELTPDRPDKPARGPATTHAQMYVMADFYGIPDMRMFAIKELARAATIYWYTQDFIDAFDLVCRSPLEDNERVLRIFVLVIKAHPTSLQNPSIETSLRRSPSFMFFLVRQSFNNSWPPNPAEEVEEQEYDDDSGYHSQGSGYSSYRQ
jgi:hypothetical protein